jgi:Tol biopolymer transport system component
MNGKILILGSAVFAMACGTTQEEHGHGENPHGHGENPHAHGAAGEEMVHYPDEKHLANVKQFTFGGDNAEAYWSFGGDKLVFQASNPNWGAACDQIYVMSLDEDRTPSSTPPVQVSTGLGRTTCAYFLPGDSIIVYASTHLGDEACPPVPERGPEGKYVWPIYGDYDIFLADLDGNIVAQLTDEPGYDAEATISPTGDRMVFTSTRSGDLELYTCALDGSDVRQVTDELGYDGGAFFSPDGEWLLWRASRPQTEEEQEAYRSLLAQGLVEPTSMELYMSRVDGSEKRQLTELGGANWAPYFHPSGKKVLFSSNHHTGGFPFNIFMLDLETGELEQVTHDSAFDSFPMFSPDGTKIAFSSNRHNGRTRNTNVFVADWVE